MSDEKLEFGELGPNPLMERSIEWNLNRYVNELNYAATELEKQARLKRHTAEMLRYLQWKVRSLQDRLDIVAKAKDGVD